MPEDIKNQFVRQHIKHWSDLGCKHNLSSIPDGVQHGKSLNWRRYQHSTSFQRLIPSRLGKKPMSTRFPELKNQYAISPYVGQEQVVALSNETGLTHKQIKTWFVNERIRNNETSEPVALRHPQILESFERNPYPSKTERLELSESTGLPYSVIRDWFVRERGRRRKNEDLLEARSERQVQKWFYDKKRSSISEPISNRQTMKMAYPELQQQFDMNPYPSQNEKIKLSEVTGLTYKQVDKWFHNERQRLGLSWTKETMSDRYPELGLENNLESIRILTQPRLVISSTRPV